MLPNKVHVAAGIILNASGLILLACRPKHLHQGGLWEFPGGKVEQGESIETALVRELKEELDIDVLETKAFMQVEHDYGDKHVVLDFLKVLAFSGEPRGMEGQKVKWVSLSELATLEFPDANKAVVEILLRN